MSGAWRTESQGARVSLPTVSRAMMPTSRTRSWPLRFSPGLKVPEKVVGPVGESSKKLTTEPDSWTSAKTCPTPAGSLTWAVTVTMPPWTPRDVGVAEQPKMLGPVRSGLCVSTPASRRVEFPRLSEARMNTVRTIGSAVRFGPKVPSPVNESSGGVNGADGPIPSTSVKGNSRRPSGPTVSAAMVATPAKSLATASNRTRPPNDGRVRGSASRTGRRGPIRSAF